MTIVNPKNLNNYSKYYNKKGKIMKTFSQFLQQIQEVLNIDNIKISDANLEIAPFFGGKYSFEHNNKIYNLDIERYKEYFFGKHLNVYDISFNVQNQYGDIKRWTPTKNQITKDNGMLHKDANYVYSHILAAIKKFLEKVEPHEPAHVLRFYGYQHVQDLLYDMFARRFLKNYERINAKTLIRKDVLDEIKKDDKDKEIQINQIKDQEQENYKSYLKNVRASKFQT
jgi:hypothetical protein